ncbi:MAG TPA: ATP synthase F0 subunit A, partial [Rubricoccaceae bacterium]
MRTYARSAVLLAAAVLLTAAPASASAGEGDEAELDAVHHTSDGTYLDFEPFGIVELPRLFLVRRADGSLGVDGFASSTAAVRSGRYHALAEG